MAWRTGNALRKQLLPGHSQFFIFSPQRTEEEFLDQVTEKLAQTSPERDMLTMKPCHCEEILKLVLSPLTQHCLVIGETTCAFYYLLEAAAASLDLSDNYMVSKLCSLPWAELFYLGNSFEISYCQVTWSKKWKKVGERKELEGLREKM